MPSIISISAEVSPNHSFAGKSVKEVEKAIGARIVLVDRQDENGDVEVLKPHTVETIDVDDRIYLFLSKNDLQKVERALEN